MSMCHEASYSEENPGSEEFLVICLCAEWCGICRDYRTGFDGLASQFPDTRFCWVDIEDHADDLGEVDVENFPTMLIRRHQLVLFFGAILPHQSHLRMLIEAFREQTPAESLAYANSNPERRGWQENQELCRLGMIK
jgi:thioredoxin 1